MRTAIVGAGLMGRWHADAARRCGGRVIAIVDPDGDRRRELARSNSNAREFAHLAGCLQELRPDVVHLCTPADTHAQLAQCSLEAGSHVLVEKPAALDEISATNLIQLAATRGLLLTVVHQCPFQQGVRDCLQLRERLGELVRLDYHAHSTAGGRGNAVDRRLWNEFLPHPYSLFRRFLGPEMDAADWSKQWESDDDLLLWSRTRGVVCRIDLSLRGRPPSHGLHVVGTRASAWIDLFHGFCVLDSVPSSRRGKILRPLLFGSRLLAASTLNLARRWRRREFAYPGLRQLVEATYAAIRRGGPSPVSPEELAGSVRMMTQVQRASAP